MTLRRRFLACTAVLCALLLTGCGDDDGTDTTGSTGSTAGGATAGTNAPAAPDLVGTSWVLASYQDAQGTAVDAAPGNPATLSFAPEGALSGSTGCNAISGTYATDGTNLTITLGPSTLRACEDPATEAQELAITQNLPTVSGYTIDGESLTLTDQDGATLFTYTAGISDLANTSWQVIGVNNGKDAVVSTELTEELTAEFGADGTFSGFGGCNQLSGPWATSGTDGLDIGPLAATMMACDAAVSELEAQYQAALEAATTFSIDGNALTLRDAEGATQVVAQLVG